MDNVNNIVDTNQKRQESGQLFKKKIILSCQQQRPLIKGRPLKNVQFCSSSRKAKILTTGIHRVFRGLKFEPDTEIG
jgi:hypothetical protein